MVLSPMAQELEQLRTDLTVLREAGLACGPRAPRGPGPGNVLDKARVLEESLGKEKDGQVTDPNSGVFFCSELFECSSLWTWIWVGKLFLLKKTISEVRGDLRETKLFASFGVFKSLFFVGDRIKTLFVKDVLNQCLLWTWRFWSRGCIRNIYLRS